MIDILRKPNSLCSFPASKMNSPSMEQAARSRLARLVAIAIAPDFGSLWWVDDHLWLAKAPGFRKPGAGLGHHPGLSIAPKLCAPDRASIPDTYPMLFGTSGIHGPFLVENLSPNSNRIASFGTLAPAILDMGDFAPPPRTRDKPVARRNRHKPSLNTEEERSLDEFLDRWTSPQAA
jgi:hypothetical protein